MLFSGFQTLDEHWLFLSREHPGFGTETYTIGSPGSQGFGLNYTSRFPEDPRDEQMADPRTSKLP